MKWIIITNLSPAYGFSYGGHPQSE